MSSNITLIFDGDCGFCTSAANAVVKRSRVLIVATPWQFTDFSKYEISEKDAADQVYLVVDGLPFGGHEAFAMILRVQPNVFIRFIGRVLMSRALAWLGRPTYRLIAKHRQRLPGGTPACKLPEK
jgi:predicted DCC family thiol-disulfide oxidoreductase YuxK